MVVVVVVVVVVGAVTVSFIENELPISEKFHVTATCRTITSTFQPETEKEKTKKASVEPSASERTGYTRGCFELARRKITRNTGNFSILPFFLPSFFSILSFRIHSYIRQVSNSIESNCVFQRLDDRSNRSVQEHFQPQITA